MNGGNEDRKETGSFRIYKCPLCGEEFSQGEERCRACPMHGSCWILCCPGCGYTFVVESQIANAFRRLWKRRTAR